MIFEAASGIFLKNDEVTFAFIRSPGPGGQNVNKVATGVQLRFNVLKSTALSDEVRLRLLGLVGKKITSTGELIIRATRYRTQERNKQDALDRLQKLITLAATPPKKRKKTKPTLASKLRRLEQKKILSKRKTLRHRKPEFE